MAKHNARQARRDAAKARAKELQEGLAAKVANLRDTDEWKRMLDVASKFHNYSFRNQMLIGFQMPHATRVAGYRKWQEVGRQVRKGEKGIKIYGFAKYKVDPEDESEDAEEHVYFPMVTVFDISQTDEITEGKNAGKWVGVDDIVKPLEGEDNDNVFGRLSEWIEGEGWKVVVGETGSAGGWMDDKAREIWVSEAGSPLTRVATLIHETAHAVLHDGITDYAEKRGMYETEAESVAYVVAGGLGFDTEQFSVGYVAGWSRGDEQVIRDSAERVLGAARSILDALLA